MISTKTGEFQFDNSELVFGPQLTLTQFKESRLRATIGRANAEFTTWLFTGTIAGLSAECAAVFSSERLCSLCLADASVLTLYDDYRFAVDDARRRCPGSEVEVINRWGDRLLAAEEARALRHGRWVQALTGHAPPCTYAWGTIDVADDMHSHVSQIWINFASSPTSRTSRKGVSPHY